MDSTSALILSEFYNSTSYLDRLLFCIENDKQLLHAPQIKNLLNLSITHLNSILSQIEFIEADNRIEYRDILSNLRKYNLFLESLIKISNANSKSIELALDYINAIYKLAYQLHLILNNNYDIECNLPSSLLATSTSDSCQGTSFIELYSIDKENLKKQLEKIEKRDPIISIIKLQRELKYTHFINKGQQQIQQKNFEEAKNYFLKASNYIENAEVLTMIAWSYSLLEQFEMAKKYCAKAIQLDSNYGPAFNDFGNYLIIDGKVQESLKWFEHAKRALNYPQREYPYINAGRAYVMLNMYDEALREFSLALALAPHHNELHQTIINLKMSMHNQNNSNTVQN